LLSKYLKEHLSPKCSQIKRNSEDKYTKDKKNVPVKPEGHTLLSKGHT